MSEWMPIETAPKGEPGKWARGPRILGVASGDGWVVYNVVFWEWHKNGKTGSWKAPDGRVWEPDEWMELPPHRNAEGKPCTP